ncbi:uncharacterized protein LOC118735121 isoform X2 [Rhagoletis pomonella]|uniref:uncharacterized protein LOC118735121 isoform X2 n=1 Tax=Rhagoletis pomonella TaxID=28610 RepID=UPI0017820069|nr:uncharacterized protein LOC118735121 isoform X2 [Rhagoletis pomonella]
MYHGYLTANNLDYLKLLAIAVIKLIPLRGTQTNIFLYICVHVSTTHTARKAFFASWDCVADKRKIKKRSNKCATEEEQHLG